MPCTPAPTAGRGLPKDPLNVARDMLFELDDVLGRLRRAIQSIVILTKDMPANCGMDALHDRHKELMKLFNDS